MKMKKLLAVLLALTMLAAAFAGCADKTEGSTSGTTGGSTSGTTGGTTGGTTTPPEKKLPDTVRIAMGGETNTFDPAGSNITQDTCPGKLIYDSLVEDDENGQIIPCLAKSWEVTDDGMVYTFHLQEGVKFHDGSKMTADDVVWSIQHFVESTFMAATIGKYVDKGEKVDDVTVKMHMKSPYSAILAMLVKQFVVESKANFEKVGADAFGMHPVGTGAYKFVKYETGVGTTLEAYADYWRGASQIKNMFLKIISDVNAVQNALETDDIDFAGVSSTVSNTAIPAFEKNANLKVDKGAPTMVWYYPINCTLKGFDDVRVRQAMAYALDREYALQVQLEGYGTIADTINAPNAFGYYGEPKFNYDVTKAKALLEEAGYKDGKGLPTLIATTRQDRQKGIEVFQSCMKEIGINVEINVMENTTYLNAVRQGDFGISLIAATMPPDVAIFDGYWMKEAIGSDNFSRLADPKLQELLPKAATSTDQAERVKLYQEAYAIANNLCAYVVAFYVTNIAVHKANLDIGGHYPDAPYLRFEEFKWF